MLDENRFDYNVYCARLQGSGLSAYDTFLTVSSGNKKIFFGEQEPYIGGLLTEFQ